MDLPVQYLLDQKGLHLSLRTICNCRKSLNVPNWREKGGNYEKGINFCDYIPLSRKHLKKIPNEAGVYEASVSLKVDYKNRRSNVIYIGSSKNLRKRIGDYTSGKLKNRTLEEFINYGDVFLRFCIAEDYIKVEKMLLKNFKNTYSELPKANSLGGRL